MLKKIIGLLSISTILLFLIGYPLYSYSVQAQARQQIVDECQLVETNLDSFTSEAVVYYSNQARLKAGLSIICIDPALMRAAQLKADHILEHDYLTHDAPDGTGLFDFVRDEGYVYFKAGENLGFNYRSAKDVVDGWLDSPKHRAILLGSSYIHMGVAIASGDYRGQEITVIVQIFGEPMWLK